MKKKLITVVAIIATFMSIINGQSVVRDNKTTILITTDSGNIKIILYEETKFHRDNFIKLVKEGYFEGQCFHRLIKNFMIQGGDPNSKNAEKGELLGQGGPGYSVPAEILPQYFHKKGALAAARKGDEVNPSKSSSGSQFYIIQGTVFTKVQLDLMVERKIHAPFTAREIEAYTTLGGSPHLDGGYTVFGEVTDGLDVLDKIMSVPVDPYDRPLTDIRFRIKIL